MYCSCPSTNFTLLAIVQNCECYKLKPNIFSPISKYIEFRYVHTLASTDFCYKLYNKLAITII